MVVSMRELKRQLFHIVVGAIVIILLCLKLINEDIILITIGIGALIAYISTKTRIPLIHSVLETFGRKKQPATFSGRGAFFFALGIFLSLKLFERDIALASIAILTLGDAFAHIFGEHVGRVKDPFGEKHFRFGQGILAGTVAGFIGGVIFVGFFESLFASFIAMIVQSADVDMNKKPIDENLLVPLTAGLMLTLTRLFF